MNTLRRCAIYTRKSSEEGLEQEFNSLDAQREACTAYIQSQRAEGWRALPEQYDDGGISGATLERPALQSLLNCIRSEQVDVVVVYKVDRLTRTLSDFARVVDIFDAHDVSFVSVTQQFNTTTSMGRLTLNVLLSFAQFEREVTGERIRDKIAASKKKGMWMGGIAPLGYRAIERRLVVDRDEASTVEQLFELYLEHGSVRKVLTAAKRTRLRTRNDNDFTKGGLYVLLQNPIYIGRVRHRDRSYPGLQEPIIRQETWEAVQTRMDQQRIRRRNQCDAKYPSLLAGKIFGPNDHCLTPSHANKKGRRYRYYIEPSNTDRSNPNSRPLRLAANEIEKIVIDALKGLLKAPAKIIGAIGIDEPSPGSLQQINNGASRLLKALGNHRQTHELVRAVITRVDVAANAVSMEIDYAALRHALDPSLQATDHRNYTLTVSATLKRLGAELKFIIDDDAAALPRQPDPSLVKAILQARRWWQLWLNGQGKSLKEISKSEGVNDRYISRLLPLAFLAPDITSMILDGRQPHDLTAERLIKHTKLPLDWTEQRRMLIARPIGQ